MSRGVAADGGAGPRPALLDPLMAGLSGLDGVGERLAAALAKLLDKADPRVRDLLFLAPAKRRDFGLIEALDEGMAETMVTLDARVLGHSPAPPGRPSPYRVRVEAAGTALDLVFFNAKRPFLERTFPVDAVVRLHGRLGHFKGRWQIVHPELLPEGGGFERAAVYPLSGGLSQGRVRSLVQDALKVVPEMPEWLDPLMVERDRLPDFKRALNDLHLSDDEEDVLRAQTRLKLDELFVMQLALGLTRQRREAVPGHAWTPPGVLGARLLAALPFKPTGAQARAVETIAFDLARPEATMRLLMGDVGSGKTYVALMAMLHVVEAGGQAALMAPTEVLARQHHAGLADLAARIGVGVDLLTGADPVPVRRKALARIASGEARLVVGTHALFQAGVDFHRLGLAVIDEQHRFGVHQRLDLVAKGKGADLLLLTATPIPRSLVMSLYGDVATARLDERPVGRQPITTRSVSAARIEEVVAGLGRALDAGGRAYWVTPAVEPGPDPRIPSALARFAWLRERFGDAVGIVHGRMGSIEKEAAMAAFKEGRTRLLVATTVVEVGIDVAEATVIVVDAAERFGLAQLHQLRGRVGRGGAASTCLLLYHPPVGAVAKERLKVLRQTEDGFRISEEDLRLRGPGEILGVRQSGLPAFAFADLARDADALATARDDATALLRRDPDLLSPRGRAARLALHLFERGEAVRHLRAG